jgi:hypothetical protein
MRAKHESGIWAHAYLVPTFRRLAIAVEVFCFRVPDGISANCCVEPPMDDAAATAIFRPEMACFGSFYSTCSAGPQSHVLRGSAFSLS